MQRIVLNREIGGFHLTRKAYDRLVELGFEPSEYSKKEYLEWREQEKTEPEVVRVCERYYPRIDRDDPRLVQIIEELGPEAHQKGALKIVEVPDGVKWFVNENEMGVEFVTECHRFWTENGECITKEDRRG